MSELGAPIGKIERRIDELKKRLKPLHDQAEILQEKILGGKPNMVDCTELLVWDRNEIRVRRNDTLEVIETREMKAEDRELNAFDGEIKIEVEDDAE